MTIHNSEMKIEAATHAIKFVEQMTAVPNENDLTPANGWNQEVMSKFCGMIRFRLI